jgi:D-inositol-3-phosphate glycosyltransferase
LAVQGHTVEVLTSALKDAKQSEVINGVHVHRVLRIPQKGLRYWFTFIVLPYVFRYARNTDLVHTTTYNAAFPAWLAAKLTRKKIVITVHEIFGSKWKIFNKMNWLNSQIHKMFENIIISLPFDRHVAISRYTEKCLLDHGIKQGKLQVIYPGIDYELFNPEKYDGQVKRSEMGLNRKFIYMYYGRPGISKGVEYLIRSVPIISKKIEDSKLVMILAKDPLDRYNTLIDEIKKLNIGDNLILIDPVPRIELPAYIAAAHCVVVPSLSEGFGFSAAEACVMQKPVVASNVASLPEVVSGKCVLVESGSPEAIADGVFDVFNKKWAMCDKKIFSWQESVDKYINVYNELLKQERRR